MKNRPLFYVFAGVVLGEGCFCISKVMAGVIAAFCLFLIINKAEGCIFFAVNLPNGRKRIVLPVLIGFTMGCSWIGLEGVMPDTQYKNVVSITGEITEIGTGKTGYLRVNPFTINGKKQNGNILLYGEVQDLLPGQIVQIQTEIKQYEEKRNPGQFDLRQYYRCRDIYYSGFFDSYTIKESKIHKGKTMLYQLKKKWIDKCKKYLSEADAGILCAMMLGEKSYMDEELKERYQKNGVAHILAISGLHISMIGGTLYKLLKWLGMPFPFAGGAAFFLIIPYCIMIGNGVAAVRAVSMLIIFIGADIKGRYYDFITSTSMAGILILAENPYYLFDAGFLLSFGAVFAIGCVYPCFKSLKRGQSLWLGISIWLVLLPIQLWFFYEISVTSIMLNFIIVPLVSPLLMCGFAGVLFSGNVFFSVCHGILVFYEKLLVFPTILVGKPSVTAIVLYSICLVVFCILMKWKKYGYGVFCMIVGLFIIGSGNQKGFSIHFLDVGQGDCIVVNSPSGYHYMIDGGSSDISKVGKYRIIPFLKSQGIKCLDYVVITHFDADHYSGIEEMIGSYEIKNLVVFENTDTNDEDCQRILKLAQSEDIKILFLSRGDRISDDQITLECLFPESDYEAEKNQQSLVFLLKYQEFDCLLTGDLELDGEADLVRMGLPKSEVLKVGHHGSQNATNEKLLEQVNPQFSVVSCGADNRYGHPHEEVVERLSKSGSEILVTAECGAVWMEEVRNEIRIKEFYRQN